MNTRWLKAFAAFSLAAACAGQGGPADGAPPAALNPLHGGTSATVPNPLPVDIVNSATAPVPTLATGTTSVAGTVAATQSGNWNVGITGTPSVNATIAGTPSVSISGTPDVNATISGTPTLNAAQSGSWSVGISGTPSVNATISGTPSVNATISGTPSVLATLSGTPTVNIGNTPSVTIANQPGAGTRFAQSIPGGQFTNLVPSGMRLVLTHVSAVVEITHGFTPTITLALPSSQDSGGAFVYLPLVPAGVDPSRFLSDLYIGSQQVDIILDAGQGVFCDVEDNSGNTGQRNSACSFFGRLINAQ
jgi:hypothetical protein